MTKSITQIIKCLLFVFLLTNFVNCSGENKTQISEEMTEKGGALFNSYCASCHVAPSIQDLSKDMWANRVLPEMGFRMGLNPDSLGQMDDVMEKQISAIKKANIVPSSPTINNEDWALLKDYIIALAPDSLSAPSRIPTNTDLVQFEPKPITLDANSGTFITYLKYENLLKKLLYGDVVGNLYEYDFKNSKNIFLSTYRSAVTDHSISNNIKYITAVGHINPSENLSGRIFIEQDGKTEFITQLQRPVHTLVTDLNGDGNNELVISEFGNLRGKLSLYKLGDSGYEKSILLEQPGAIRTVQVDMNNDGKDDLVTLFAQGDENISIFYQGENLNFRAEKVIRFSPVYGSSWFEVMDFNGDGFKDIITVHGDNADLTFLNKSYHGLRIHINDGTNHFSEKYFYALNGATRLIAHDFDQDGDVDFGIVSTFPDYVNKPQYSFVYLENNNAQNFDFTASTFKNANLGRWFLMDKGDIDEDGDQDIILSSFSTGFAPIPEALTTQWEEDDVDLMILENKLVNSSQQ